MAAVKMDGRLGKLVYLGPDGQRRFIVGRLCTLPLEAAEQLVAGTGTRFRFRIASSRRGAWHDLPMDLDRAEGIILAAFGGARRLARARAVRAAREARGSRITRPDQTPTLEPTR